MVYGVILAGGKGERFWPLSRADRPKQFLRLTSDKMMLEETIDRVLPLTSRDNIRVVTSESMKATIIGNKCRISEDYIITEPVGRNTCAAIGLAAIHLTREDPDAVMVVLSADHIIRPPDKLIRILKAGTEVAKQEERLILIGIVPTRPETAYGYIKLGQMFRHEGDQTFHEVTAFTEKPKAAVAHEYYYSHNYLWNSGMFIWSAQVILKEIKRCMPDLGDLLEEYGRHIGTSGEKEARKKLYDEAPSISIDFAVLERAENVLTVKADIIWDDIGGWNALTRYKETDLDNNVKVGNVVTLDSFETVVYNNNPEGLIACLGVSDLVVVNSDDITLVVHKTKADRIKEILSKLKEDEDKRKYL